MQSVIASYRELPTHSDGLITGYPPTGIGYLRAWRNLLIICNLDKNLEIAARNSDNTITTLAIFNKPSLPLDDEQALYELDCHEVMIDRFGSVFAINHLGQLRRFERIEEIVGSNIIGGSSASCKSRTQLTPRPVSTFLPVAEFNWFADVERSFLFEDCLISTSAGEFKVPGPARPGLFFSDPISKLERSAADLVRLEGTAYFAEWGRITAAELAPEDTTIAFAAESRIAISKIDCSSGLVKPGKTHWEQELSFCCKLLFLAGDDVFACGYDLTDAGEDDFVGLHNGGMARLRRSDGKILEQAFFDWEPGWGNGARPIAHAPAHNAFYGVDRFANLYRIDASTLRSQRVGPVTKQEKTLGAAHLVFVEDQVLAGYNRGGYKLHSWKLS